MYDAMGTHRISYAGSLNNATNQRSKQQNYGIAGTLKVARRY